jgi:protein phosphatase
MKDGSLFVVVADGMGGHEAGEVASALAVRVLEEHICETPSQDPRQRLYSGLLEANEAILEEAKTTEMRGMGTTAIVTVVQDGLVHVGQVGDSRLYHIRKGQLIWRTRDHTRVQMLLEQGDISEDAARQHPEAGMLTRALGHARMADGRPLVPDVLEEPFAIEAEDTIVLSSDGLHDLVDDWEIGQLVADTTAKEAAEKLVELACERGGHDNVTVAVLVAGERSAAFDPDFLPDWVDADHVATEPIENIEATYDDLQRFAETPVQSDAQESSSNKLVLYVSVAVLVMLVLSCGVAVGVWQML